MHHAAYGGQKGVAKALSATTELLAALSSRRGVDFGGRVRMVRRRAQQSRGGGAYESSKWARTTVHHHADGFRCGAALCVHQCTHFFLQPSAVVALTLTMTTIAAAAALTSSAGWARGTRAKLTSCWSHTMLSEAVLVLPLSSQRKQRRGPQKNQQKGLRRHCPIGILPCHKSSQWASTPSA